MTAPITKARLENAVKALNETFGFPNEPYKHDADGKAMRDEKGHPIANVGTFYADYSNGGVRVERMCDGGGSRDVTMRGTKKECYWEVQAMLNGARLMEDWLMPRYLVEAWARQHCALGKFEKKTFSCRAGCNLNDEDRDWVFIEKLEADGYEVNGIIKVTAV